MILILGLLACVALWWITRRMRARGAVATARLLRRVAAWAALALAAVLLLRGQTLAALLLGLGGVWLLEGAERAGRRARDFLSGLPGLRSPRRSEADRRLRTDLIEVLLGPDGAPAAGAIVSGPAAGRGLDTLTPAEARDLHAFCARHDPSGMRLLETYLDRRRPGWRVDAEADRDPRPGRPPKPGAMTEEEAHQVLGLQRGASPEEIRLAHRTLMKRAHPDQGGSAERAARINAARDRLTNRHR